MPQLLAGEVADACWTDPPYNVGYEGKAGSFENDDLPDVEFTGFLLSAFVGVFDGLKAGGAIYIAHADTEGLNFRAAFESAGFKLASCLIWVKDSLVLSRADYHWRHEPILYGWKPGRAHHWSGGRKQTSIVDLTGSVFTIQRDGSCLVRVGNEALIIRGTDLTVEAVEPTTLHHDRPKSSADHPTMKPVDLVWRMVKNSTRHGEIVLDPFGGAGSTLIACEMLGRCARVVELEPRFVDVTIRRWQEFTGQIARLDGTGAAFHEVEEARQSSLQLTG